jgi:hypothetical protein
VASTPSKIPTQAQVEKENRSNAELLHEVFRVVLLREPATPGEFGTLLGSLNQGASFEGIYNGMTHSDSYRSLEQQNLGATPEALKAFSNEMETLQAEMNQPTRFTPQSAKPLQKAVELGMIAEDDSDDSDPSPAVSAVDFTSPKINAPKNFNVSAEQISQSFVGASVFTLKRVLGDEALKLIDEKKASPDTLSRWYSKWVVHMASLHVDFGLALRNKSDEKFHFEWAEAAPEDSLIWEVLNRLHRVINQAQAQLKKP